MTSDPNELEAKVTTAAWKNKPSFYVVADQGRMIARDLEKKLAAKLNAKIIHISSSYVVMLSHPTEVAKFISEAAEAQWTALALLNPQGASEEIDSLEKPQIEKNDQPVFLSAF